MYLYIAWFATSNRSTGNDDDHHHQTVNPSPTPTCTWPKFRKFCTLSSSAHSAQGNKMLTRSLFQISFQSRHAYIVATWRLKFVSKLWPRLFALMQFVARRWRAWRVRKSANSNTYNFDASSRHVGWARNDLIGCAIDKFHEAGKGGLQVYTTNDWCGVHWASHRPVCLLTRLGSCFSRLLELPSKWLSQILRVEARILLFSADSTPNRTKVAANYGWSWAAELMHSEGEVRFNTRVICCVEYLIRPQGWGEEWFKLCIICYWCSSSSGSSAVPFPVGNPVRVANGMCEKEASLGTLRDAVHHDLELD